MLAPLQAEHSAWCPSYYFLLTPPRARPLQVRVPRASTNTCSPLSDYTPYEGIEVTGWPIKTCRSVIS
jgi:hypothetical protein